MKHNVVCVVEYTPHNLSAYLKDIGGVYATGKDAAEIERRMREGVQVYIDECQADGMSVPEALTGEWELVFQYDMHSFLTAYSDTLTKTALSRLTGINPKQLHHYSTGLSKPRPATVQKVAEGIRAFGRQLANTNFV